MIVSDQGAGESGNGHVLGMGSTIVCAVDIDDDGESQRALRVAADLGQRLGLALVVAYVAPPAEVAVSGLAGGAAASGLAPGDEAAIVAPPPVIPEPVAPPAAELADIYGEARRRIERLLAQCHVNDVQIGVALNATAADGLRRAAKDCDAELLVIGSRGCGTVRAALLGSTSHSLVDDATCPIVVVPDSTDD